MTDNTIWLIHHKSKIGEQSPLNMDGSEFAFAVGIVSADTLIKAINVLSNHLNKQILELVDISSCKIYQQENYFDDSEDSQEIRAAVDSIKDQPEGVTWACGITSECLESLENANGQ